jgi:hypothetical protein
MGASCSPKFEAKFFLNGPLFSLATQSKFTSPSEYPISPFTKMRLIAALINNPWCVRYLFSGNSSLVLHLNKTGFNFLPAKAILSATLISVYDGYFGLRRLGFTAATIFLGGAYFFQCQRRYFEIHPM